MVDGVEAAEDVGPIHDKKLLRKEKSHLGLPLPPHCRPEFKQPHKFK